VELILACLINLALKSDDVHVYVYQHVTGVLQRMYDLFRCGILNYITATCRS